MGDGEVGAVVGGLMMTVDGSVGAGLVGSVVTGVVGTTVGVVGSLVGGTVGTSVVVVGVVTGEVEAVVGERVGLAVGLVGTTDELVGTGAVEVIVGGVTTGGDVGKGTVVESVLLVDGIGATEIAPLLGTIVPDVGSVEVVIGGSATMTPGFGAVGAPVGTTVSLRAVESPGAVAPLDSCAGTTTLAPEGAAPVAARVGIDVALCDEAGDDEERELLADGTAPVPDGPGEWCATAVGALLPESWPT